MRQYFDPEQPSTKDLEAENAELRKRIDVLVEARSEDAKNVMSSEAANLRCSNNALKDQINRLTKEVRDSQDRVDHSSEIITTYASRLRAVKEAISD
jgi:predicted  nucleic acid-binding Zn-ribbon protein